MTLAAILISVAALVTTIIVAVKQHSQADTAAQINGRLLAIEETRFQWDREAREAAGHTEATHDEQQRSAVFGIRFGFRDSAQTWGRLIARNDGPADARDVLLKLGAVVSGKAVEVEAVGGTDYGKASVLQPNESVHVGVAFTMGSPSPEDLTYSLTWMDDRGPHQQQGRVPLY